ncbi:hypothetical protein Tco_1275793 [Tanacetum coccineum]
MDDAMRELAKLNYVQNRFAKHICDNVDTKNTITFRASLNLLKFVLDVTNEYEKKAIRDMGFGSVIKFKIDMIPKALGRWLVDHFDSNTCILMYRNTKLEITGKFVHEILWVPDGSIKINLVSRASNASTLNCGKINLVERLFYVHSTTMGKGKENRNVPAIRYWNSEMLRAREKEDLESGGFILKTQLDSGKKKENLVCDTGTIYRAEEEFASVLTSEFEKIVNMFVKIDGVIGKRLKICPDKTRVPFERSDERPEHPKEVYPPILDITHFWHFLNLLESHDHMANLDDEPMWAADRVVALTPGLAITILETANEFTIKGNHLTLIKGSQFDGRIKTDAYNT